MLTIEHDGCDTIVRISCDGPAVTGALVIDCAAPVVVRGDAKTEWVSFRAKQEARAAGWAIRLHDRLGDAFLCPLCA